MGVIHLWVPDFGRNRAYTAVYKAACGPDVACCLDDMPEFNARVTCKKCKRNKPGATNDLRPMVPTQVCSVCGFKGQPPEWCDVANCPSKAASDG